MATLKLHELPRLWRTVRHLKPSQVGWRLKYLVQRRLETHHWLNRPGGYTHRIEIPHVAVASPHFPVHKLAQEPISNRLSELLSGRLTLLNDQQPFSGKADWHFSGDHQRNRLRNFTLHYHGWLSDLATEFEHSRNPIALTELRRWLVDWLDNCPLRSTSRNPFAWNSFNIGQRLWHWREIAGKVPANFWNHPDLSSERFLNSVFEQADYLANHLEWDLRGNHLFKDAVGLAAAADLLGNKAPLAWLSQATEIAVSQVAEQILPDGMHFERSPMYHIHVLEDLLALSTLLRDDAAIEILRAACQKMAVPLRWMAHPCGVFPLFNDAADHQVSLPAELAAELHRRGILTETDSPNRLRHFSSAGLIAWHGSPWTVFFDAGAVGPDYQPGHAHADSLTLELSYQGQRLVVDPGTCCYDHDDRRLYDRSTKAHNTVCIDDTNSSEVWHIFRVGRRARPMDVHVAETESGFAAAASHTGYDHLPGSPIHRRSIRLDGETRLEIQDMITGEGQHHLEGGFLLSPEWTAAPTQTGWTLRQHNHKLRVDLHANQPVRTDVVHRPWHPEFGKEFSTPRLVWSGDVTLPFRLQTTWYRG